MAKPFISVLVTEAVTRTDLRQCLATAGMVFASHCYHAEEANFKCFKPTALLAEKFQKLMFHRELVVGNWTKMGILKIRLVVFIAECTNQL